MRQYSFEKLKVWEDIRGLIRLVYEETKKFPGEEKFGLVMQLRRAAISVSSNIAEGSSRMTSKDQAYFYNTSYSSLMEVLSQIIVSNDLDYLENEKYENMRVLIEKISQQISNLRKSALNRSKP